MKDNNLQLDVDGDNGNGAGAGNGDNDRKKAPKKKSVSPRKRTAGNEGGDTSPRKRHAPKKATFKVEEEEVVHRDEDTDDAGVGSPLNEA
jgi:hypothetical protein